MQADDESLGSSEAEVVPRADLRPFDRAQFIRDVRVLIAARGNLELPDAPPVRQELVDLGQALAFDKILSGSNETSCMTCHPAGLGTDDDRQLSLGIRAAGSGAARTTDDLAHSEEPRNAPPLFNLHVMDKLFWDGRVEVLASGDIRTPAGDQLTPEMKAVFEFGAISALPMFPVTARDEMRGFPGDNEIADIQDGHFQEIWAALMHRIGEVPRYREMFEAAYPGTAFDDMTFAHASNAIGGFIITAFQSNNSPWDQFLRGDDTALDDEQLVGADKFLRSCVNCHNGPVLSDQLFHNTAVAQFGPGKGDSANGHDDFGRERVTGDPADRYRFRTTPLRNLELTGPFGHDGAIVDLRAFVQHYVDPKSQLEAYDVSQIDDHLEPTLQDNVDAIIANVDPLFVRKSPIFGMNVRPLTAFMEAQTDPAARDLSHTVPASVPSGLPIED